MSTEIAVKEKKSSGEIVKESAWSALSEESQKAYTFDYKLFSEFNQKPPSEITANDILIFLEYLRKEKYKNSTINRKMASLSKYFSILKMAGEVKTNPVEDLKKFKKISYPVNRQNKTTLTIADIKEAIEKKDKVEPSDKETILLIRFLAKTGLRISELINIKYSDISEHDKNNQKIRIVGKGRKERFIFIDKKFLVEIKKVFTEFDGNEFIFYGKTDFKFGGKLDRFDCYYAIRDFFRRKLGRHVHPHMIRHTFATHKISVEKKDIKAVSKFLGHHSPSITMEFYVDTALDAESANIDI